MGWQCGSCWVDWHAQGIPSCDADGLNTSVFLLGPSHFERKSLTCAKFPWTEVGSNVVALSNGRQHVMGVASLPVYNQVTLRLLRRSYSMYGQVVWCVSNWFFGNKDVGRIQNLENVRSPDDLFLWSHFYPGIVERQLMTQENNAVLVQHSLRCIDAVVKEMPRLKLLFWCLAKRTFNKGGSQQIPVSGQYDAVVERYGERVLDVLKYHDRSAFDRKCCRDRSGHPTFEGFRTICQLMDDALEARTSA